MVRVLGRVTSINVRKVLWALEEFDESYDREDWGLPIRDPKVPEFLALNPNGQVPAFIDDDGLALWESNAVLLYLAKSRSALMPVDNHAHARALQWLIWQATELNPPWGMRSMPWRGRRLAMTTRQKLPNQSPAGPIGWKFSKPNSPKETPSSRATAFRLPTSSWGFRSIVGSARPSRASRCLQLKPIMRACVSVRPAPAGCLTISSEGLLAINAQNPRGPWAWGLSRSHNGGVQPSR